MSLSDFGVGAARETVVLLHSSGSSSRQWSALIERLSPRYDMRAVDLHGHGAQPAWPGRQPLALTDEVTLVEPILREAGPVHLVGHSYGGAVALKVAELHPRSVRSLVAYEPVLFRWLYDADPASDAAREVIEVAAAIRKALHARSYSGAARPFVDYWSGTGAWDAMPEPRRQAIAARMGSVLPHFDALFNDDRIATTLHRIEAPMMLLTGASTVASTRRIGQMLRAALPRAVHALLPRLGHMGPIAHADAVNGCIAGFLQGLSSVRMRGPWLREAARAAARSAARAPRHHQAAIGLAEIAPRQQELLVERHAARRDVSGDRDAERFLVAGQRQQHPLIVARVAAQLLDHVLVQRDIECPTIGARGDPHRPLGVGADADVNDRDFHG